MCGLVGIINKNNAGFTLHQENAFFDMLFADTLRGQDSTGVVGVTRHGDMHIAKEALEATFVIPQIKDMPFFRESMSTLKTEGKIWIGHNRKSTVGKTNDANAHPFVIDKKFAFVHNGTLFNHEALAKTDVDSKALAIVLYEAMGKEDWKDSLEELLGRVWGAYACVWYDQRTHKLHMIRNKERPLSIIETPNAYYWASEPQMAWWILTRNNYKDTECKLIPVKENTLISFNVEGNTTMTETEVSPKKSYSPVVVTGKGKIFTNNFGGGTPSNRPANWSKQQLKNFKKAHEGRLIRFWVDDYVEHNVAETIATGAKDVILLGQCEDILTKHVVRGSINLDQLGLSSEEDLTARMWMGACDWIEYDKDIKEVILNVARCKPVVNSISFPKGYKKPPFPPNPYKLSEEAVNEGNVAIRERVEKMKDQYENIGFSVMERTNKQGRIELVNVANNEVLYETPVAVH